MLQQLFAANARESCVILTFNSACSQAVEKQTQFAEEVSCFKGSLFACLVEVLVVDATCANSDEVQVLAEVSLLNDNIVWFTHLWDYTAN